MSFSEVLVLSDMKDVLLHIHYILKKISTVEELLIISDVDGTLTNLPNPENDMMIDIKPRDGIINFLKDITLRKIKIIFSSAWNNFNETLSRINKTFNLKNQFKTNESSKTLNWTSPNGRKKKLYYFAKNNIISVKDEKDDNYFYQKALAPYLAFSQEELDKVKYVVFLDDSFKNHLTFKKDVIYYGLYSNAKIVNIQLVN